MTVKELKDQLNAFDDNMEVVIGLRQVLGTNFANEIRGCLVGCNVTTPNGRVYRTVAITEGITIGDVDYIQEKTTKKEIETMEEGIEELKRRICAAGYCYRTTADAGAGCPGRGGGG